MSNLINIVTTTKLEEPRQNYGSYLNNTTDLNQPEDKFDKSFAGKPQESFREFYNRNYRDLVKLAFLFVRNIEVAEDITQDSFLSISKKYKELLNPDAYIRVALVNKCKTYIRSKVFERKKLEKLMVNVLEISDEKKDILDVLEMLSQKQKTAVILRYYLCFSDKEIARIIKCRSSSVSSLIVRSLNIIKKRIDFDDL
jgi:RNA polymerase sigma factor (sigma-70 family)